MQHTDSLRSRGWNAELCSLIESPPITPEESRYKAQKVNSLLKRFRKSAVRAAVAVILHPNQFQPLKNAGVAGGIKYSFEGLFLKVSNNAYSLYGMEDIAHKAATNELRALQTLISLFLPGVFVPVSVVVSFLGRTVLVEGLLPLHETSLIGGSQNAGMQNVAIPQEVSSILERVAQSLHLQPHRVAGVEQEIWFAADVEFHLGTDSRVYAVDAGRLLPPMNPSISHSISPNENTIYQSYWVNAHLTQLFRPEFMIELANTSIQLSCDAFSKVSTQDASYQQYEQRAAEATVKLTDLTIPYLIQELVEDARVLMMKCNFLEASTYSGAMNEQQQRQRQRRHQSENGLAIQFYSGTSPIQLEDNPVEHVLHEAKSSHTTSSHSSNWSCWLGWLVTRLHQHGVNCRYLWYIFQSVTDQRTSTQTELQKVQVLEQEREQKPQPESQQQQQQQQQHHPPHHQQYGISSESVGTLQVRYQVLTFLQAIVATEITVRAFKHYFNQQQRDIGDTCTNSHSISGVAQEDSSEDTNGTLQQHDTDLLECQRHAAAIAVTSLLCHCQQPRSHSLWERNAAITTSTTGSSTSSTSSTSSNTVTAVAESTSLQPLHDSYTSFDHHSSNHSHNAVPPSQSDASESSTYGAFHSGNQDSATVTQSSPINLTQLVEWMRIFFLPNGQGRYCNGPSLLPCVNFEFLLEQLEPHTGIQLSDSCKTRLTQCLQRGEQDCICTHPLETRDIKQVRCRYKSLQILNMVTALEQTGRTEQVIDMFEMELKMRTDSLSPHHPVVGKSYIHLAHLYSNAGHTSQASQCYQRGLCILLHSLVEILGSVSWFKDAETGSIPSMSSIFSQLSHSTPDSTSSSSSSQASTAMPIPPASSNLTAAEAELADLYATLEVAFIDAGLFFQDTGDFMLSFSCFFMLILMIVELRVQWDSDRHKSTHETSSNSEQELPWCSDLLYETLLEAMKLGRSTPQFQQGFDDYTSLGGVLLDRDSYTTEDVIHSMKAFLFALRHGPPQLCQLFLPDPYLAVAAILNVGGVPYFNAQYVEAGRFFDLAIRAATSMNATGLIASAYHYRSLILIKQGQLPEAKTLMHSALHLLHSGGNFVITSDRDRSATHAYSSATFEAGLKHSLARVHLYLKEYDTAKQLLEEAYRLRSLAYGQNHPEVAKTRGQLGNVLMEMGNFEDAEFQMRAAVDCLVHVWGPIHPITARSKLSLGQLYAKMNRWDEATDVLKQCVDDYEQQCQGQPNDMFARALIEYGKALQQCNNEGSVAVIDRGETMLALLRTA